MDIDSVTKPTDFSIKMPSKSFSNSGQGSSFLSFPTKRNFEPGDCSQGFISLLKRPNQTYSTVEYLDFKKAFLPIILNLMSPEERESQSYLHSVEGSLIPSQSQWNQVAQLRIHAGGPERTEDGVLRLMRYFVQLCYLEEKFCFETDNLNLEFSWFEAFSSRKGKEKILI
jgi:hypothetical protein